MKIDILTLFPKMFAGPFAESIVARAQDRSLLQIEIHNLRDWATDKRGSVDDRPFGGGVGMIMTVDIVDRALAALKPGRVILLTPQGRVFNQKLAQNLSKIAHLILICGHYEGFDERIRKLVDEEISIGDYVLTGGEIPAMVMVDAITRLIPGVLEKPEATKFESFSPLLEYPQYTRPADFKSQKVPEILLSGDHQKIADWRQQKALAKTKKLRPDLLKK
ncbi:tRNA (guanosine(37)-N1)-methyltransferase TrmD [Candidatus Shapirobacteria bacterium CG09_land_8_20_14_0_10_47_13]|uniref:tRNA (guanine-N(1)-)-methyltransferase n=1 Tax=Candidatus Shapirobacteria bacterium CG09_land_8_20_14_0_10_47_13 TaxID=1974481 RepID=A0A2H0WMJ1_9BACT|nr:MAG: tRNA (guanosine(37)-N1)-methyltransferase TrmD [Candidatus Shapirobacteria bacterium CG09_land_8_20_14_0_10_47_13]